MKEEYREFLSHTRVIGVYLRGIGFGNGENYNDGVGDYHSHDPRVCATIRQYALSRADWNTDGGEQPDTIRLATPEDDRMLLQVFSDSTEANGPLYTRAMKLMAADLARQTRDRVGRLRRQIVGMEILFPVSRPVRIGSEAEIRQLVKALTLLDGRAFTLGEGGSSVYVDLLTRSGKKEHLRLRPPTYEVAKSAIRSGRSPLPPPLSRVVYGHS